MKASAFIKKKNGVETTKICRWCLSTSNALEPLANDESGQYKLQKLLDFTGLQANVLPGVPSYLCSMCESRLDKMYTFRWRCNKNIALTKKLNTAKNEVDISKDNLGHSAEQTLGTELLIKTENNTSDAAHDLHLFQRSCTVCQVNGTYECCGNQPDDLFEAEENPIAIKLENEDVDEQNDSQKNPIDVNCQDREDPSATTNSGINDSASESMRNAIAPIDPCKRLEVHTCKKSFACKICKKAYCSLTALSVHSKIHNKDEYKQCPHCSSKFARLFTLKNHIRIHTAKKPFVCKICDKTFRSRNILAQHEKVHNKDQHLLCPHCPSKFALLSTLKNHIRIHTGEKPFACKICKKAFHSSAARSNHSKIHNKDNYRQCPHCPSKFALLAPLKNHIRIHTGEKPFACKICKKAFHSSAALSVHSKFHKKDEYKQCPHCPSKFALLATLKNHIRIHTGEKPFVCKICKKAFHSSPALSKHSKIHKRNQ